MMCSLVTTYILRNQQDSIGRKKTNISADSFGPSAASEKISMTTNNKITIDRDDDDDDAYVREAIETLRST